MLDFCITFPYAALLAIGGMVAWVTAEDRHTLSAGAAAASVLLMCAQTSLRAFDQGRLAKRATAVSLAVAIVLTAVSAAHYARTGQALPGAVVGPLSAAVAAFYVWVLRHGPLPQPKPVKGKAAMVKKTE